MRILSKSDIEVKSLLDWETHCPPARKIHWKAGRSAMETAKAWLDGTPKEFLQLLGSNFSAQEVYPEYKSAFDNYKGNNRNHDLLVIGNKPTGEKTVICVESKVDEYFGENNLTKQIEQARKALFKNPDSKALQRIQDLRIALFGKEDGKQLDLRYQLLTAVAGSIAEANKQGVRKVYFVIQTFITPGINAAKYKRNQQDLDDFINQLSKGKYKNIHTGDVLGPVKVPGTKNISNKIELYIGKIEINIE